MDHMNPEVNTPPDCPLCPSNNLLKTPIIAENDGAYLIDAYQSPGNFLIIPKMHVESLATLPDTWWQAVKGLLPSVPGQPASYNLSCNLGKPAGQTVKHLHFWIIPRDTAQPTAGRGLASFVNQQNQE
jgi:diadenosine tetraphosphate (Ap4A) HIT family hydrolase